MYKLMIIISYVALSAALLMKTKWFRETTNRLWNQWKHQRFFVKSFSVVFLIYMTVFAAVKPPAAVPEGLESIPYLQEVLLTISGKAPETTKNNLEILANGYKRLSETSDSFISRTVTNTQLTWLVMPTNAIVYSGWTNYGVAEDIFWVNATNLASSWGFVYADDLVDGAHVSSSGTLSFDVPKGSPTPHEMPDGTGIDFLAPFHSTLSVIPPDGRFWHYATDSNSVRFTWQNFLVGRDTNNAISFQCELFNNGDYTFRYAFPPNFLSFTNDFVIGAQFGGVGETYAMNNYSNLANGLDINWDLPDSTLDTDGDGTYDIVELYYGFDPKVYTPEDWDNDGLLNNYEYYYTNSVSSTNGLERLNARLFDSDGDKLPDIFEVMYDSTFNPLVAYSTTNECLTGNPDNDDYNNAHEMAYGTNPLLVDTIPSVDTNLYPDIINCTLELSTTDTNDYMLLVLGESTNIFVTADNVQSNSYTLPLCSTNQLLDVKLSRNLEVQSNDSPILSDVTSRVYTMDPWVITCYGDNYPGYRPPLPYSLNSTITRNSSGGGGGTSFYIPTMTVDIVSSYSDYYYYIMCGCNNLESDLDVAAEVCIEGGDGLIGTPYIFNPEPITCTASGGGSVFQQSTNEYIIDIGSTIINFYSLYEYAYFTLDMGVDNLENFDEEGNYNYNISVEATEERMGTDDDDVDIPVDIRYSHGSWSIMSMITPTNAINILNSTNASVGIDFHHSECANYDLYGTLYITPDGNTDIFTLDNISRNIYIEESPYSTSEGFEVIGCSDDFGDMIVDLEFSGDEYHLASYSLTSYALVVSNLTDGISMFTGLEDADNDGTNNVHDLDNAGDFMPILVKTHETATSAFFSFDFNDTKVKIWTKDGTMTRTNSTDFIQEGHNYSYNDLFADGVERTFYIQALEPGKHDIDVTYVLDGYYLPAEEVSVTFAELKIKCNDVFTNAVTVNVGQKISLEASFEPDVFDNVVFQWDIPGYNNFIPDVIKNYITTAEQGTVETLEWNDFDESIVDFYWVKAVTNNVECTATVDGEDYTKGINFSVQKPTCSFTSALTIATPPVGIRETDSNTLRLEYGEKNLFRPGITWYPEVTTGTNASGTIALIQLIKFHIVHQGINNFIVSTGNDYVVDDHTALDLTYITYSGVESSVSDNSTTMLRPDVTGYVEDSPDLTFDQAEFYIESQLNIGDAALTHCYREDQFTTYLMYKPSGDDSVWVPLKKMTWFWSGAATKGTNDVWTLDSGNSPTVDPVGVDTYSFPEWNSTFKETFDFITVQ